VEVYLRWEDALASMQAAIRDEPQWVNVLRIELVNLDETQPTPN
jgi:hypothetical protein